MYTVFFFITCGGDNFAAVLKRPHHMEDWLDDFKYFAREARFFDISDEELFSLYAKQHFKTTGQEHNAWQNVAKLLQPIIRGSPERVMSPVPPFLCAN